MERPIQRVLDDLPSPALDQKHQHDKKANPCNYPDNRYAVHTQLLFFSDRPAAFGLGGVSSPAAYIANRTPSREE